jgi:hypothetical protein
MEMKRRSISIFIFTFLLNIFLTSSTWAAHWPMFGGDETNNRNAASESAISPSTVSGLVPKWATSVNGFYLKTPVIDDAVYLTTSSSLPDVPSGWIYKLDKNNGAVLNSANIRDVLSQCLRNDKKIPSAFDIQTSPALSGDNLIVTTARGYLIDELYPDCDFSNPPDSVIPVLTSRLSSGAGVRCGDG